MPSPAPWLAALVAALPLLAGAAPPAPPSPAPSSTAPPIDHEPPEAQGVPNLTGQPLPRTLPSIDPYQGGYTAALRPDHPAEGIYAILVSETGGVAAAWMVKSAPPYDGMILHSARRQVYQPYPANGKPSKWKAQAAYTVEAAPESDPAGRVKRLERLPPVPAASWELLYYASSVDEPAEVRDSYLKALVEQWQVIGRSADAVEIANGMLRQLASAAAFLGDPVPAFDPLPPSKRVTPSGLSAEMRPLAYYPRAAWPREGLPDGLTGQAVVDVDLDDAGVVRKVARVEASSPLFEKSAILAATLSRFKAGSAHALRITYLFPPADAPPPLPLAP